MKSDKPKTDYTELVFRYRYLIAIILFLTGVCFKLNGSSIGMWNQYVQDPSNTETVMQIGPDRPIRSDEWCVYTPMALSQYYNDFKINSQILRASDTDVTMVYAQCVRDWSIIFRPFLIGYLFLSPARGLSFYWCSKTLVLFVVSLEFGLLFLGRRRLLSTAYACMVTFAPVIQWWFSVNAFPDMMVYGQALLLFLAAYMNAESYRDRILYAGGFFWMAGAYLLVLYPAWQISFFYVFLPVGIWIIVRRLKNFTFDWKKDIPILIAWLFVFCLCMGLILYRSWDTITTVMNSVYPGQREDPGGGGLYCLFRYTANPLFPFAEVNVPGNVCESAAFYDVFPAGLLLAVITLRKNQDKLTCCLLAAAAFLGIYVLVGFPVSAARITLMGQVTTGRCAVALSYVNLLLLFRGYYLWSGPARDKPAYYLFIILFAISVILCSRRLLYGDYYTAVGVIICTSSLAIFLFSLLREVKTFCCIVVVLSLAMGGTVNPLRFGIEDIYNNSLGRKIEELARQDKSKWIAVSDIWISGDYPIIFGAPTINSTNTYMNKELWKILDPEGEYEDVYNRYAHIVVQIDNSIEDGFHVFSPSPDLVTLTINTSLMVKLGVRYVLTNQELEKYNDNNIVFTQVFAKEGFNYRIYKLTEQ